MDAVRSTCTTAATEEEIQKVVAALAANNIEAVVVDTA
jgi:hypothetical protein